MRRVEAEEGARRWLELVVFADRVELERAVVAAADQSRLDGVRRARAALHQLPESVA